MDAHSESFTVNGTDGKDCGDGYGGGVEMGMGAGGFAAVRGNVTDVFNVEVKTSCVAEPGRDSLTGAILAPRRGDSGGAT